MKRKYTFFDGGTVIFDDSGSVSELIAYAFEQFGYYEPFGMDCVTVFQGHHPETNTGWFTTDVTLSCAEEIRLPDTLCFAYHLPGAFYFAEGGWGHHMTELGNHPEIPEAVSLNIRFEGFDNTVVINGSYCFDDIISALKRVGYIPASSNFIEVLPIGCAQKSYMLSISDPIMKLRLTDFHSAIAQYHKDRITLAPGEFIYHEVFRIC